jgi:hypothetical protein
MTPNLCSEGRYFFYIVEVIFLLILLPALSQNVIAQAPAKKDSLPHSDLAAQVNDPTAPLKLLMLRDVIAPGLPSFNGTGNLLELQPEFPIKSKHLPLQLIKATIPFVTLPDPKAATGLGDIQIFDLLTFKEKWGSWGIGLGAVFPTASSPDFGAGKWQLGPAWGIIYTRKKNLVAGAVFQNLISIAGNPEREDVNELAITPSLTCIFPHGWFGGYSDFEITFDWENSDGTVIPLGLQVGKIFKIGSNHLSFSVEAGWNAGRSSQLPPWLFGLEMTLILHKVR